MNTPSLQYTRGRDECVRCCRQKGSNWTKAAAGAVHASGSWWKTERLIGNLHINSIVITDA